PATKPTTTTGIPTTTTVVAIPTVVDRGADDVEVVRSLLLFGRWLEAEHPDPALVDRAFAWGGDLWRSVGPAVATLERAGPLVIAGPVSRAGAMAEGSGELQGGTFGVGIETSTGGTIMLGVGSGSATLPRLVTFQWTPLAPGPLGSLENLCNAAGGPVTDPAR